MPAFGPWLPTDPADHSGGFVTGVVSEKSAPSYSVALEGPFDLQVSDISSNFLFRAEVLPDSGGSPFFRVDQKTAFGGTVPTVADNPLIDPSLWPADATGYEYRDPVGVITSLRFFATIASSLTTSGASAPIAARLVAIPDTTDWVTPEIAAAAIVLWSGTPPFPGGIAIDVDLTPATTAGRPLLAVYTDAFPPTIVSIGDAVEVDATGSGWYAHLTYSDHRFTYSTLPALRQFPRDDFLGGAPRQVGSRSVQASARQGWHGSYR